MELQLKSSQLKTDKMRKNEILSENANKEIFEVILGKPVYAK